MATNEELEAEMKMMNTTLSLLAKSCEKQALESNDRFIRLETAHNNLVKEHNTLKEVMLDIFRGGDGK